MRIRHRAGTMTFVARLLCLGVFVTLLVARPCSSLEPVVAHCGATSCFAIFTQQMDFNEAHEFCKGKRGFLATVRTTRDAEALRKVVSDFQGREGSPANVHKTRIWIGLRKSREQCVQRDKLLRGFHWVSDEDDGSYSNWSKEPALSCTTEQCVTATLRTSKRLDLKWRDRNCSQKAMVLCRFTFQHMCDPIPLSGAGITVYTTPFGTVKSSLTAVPSFSRADALCERRKIGWTIRATCSGSTWSPPSLACLPAEPAKDSCAQNNGGCEHHCVPLVNGVRQHSCECDVGYKLAADGRSCDDEDECATNPCEMLCTNSHGSYHCGCVTGFVPDPQNGRACVPEDVCVLRNCEHGCVVGLGKEATCSCPSGFTLDGNLVNCTDVDECESSLCDQGCKNSVGSFRCFCRDGFELDHDGSTCFAVNEDVQRQLENILDSHMFSSEFANEYLDTTGDYYEDDSFGDIDTTTAHADRTLYPIFRTVHMRTASRSAADAMTTTTPKTLGREATAEPQSEDVGDRFEATCFIVGALGAGVVLFLVGAAATIFCVLRKSKRRRDEHKKTLNELWVPSPAFSAAQSAGNDQRVAPRGNGEAGSRNSRISLSDSELPSPTD